MKFNLSLSKISPPGLFARSLLIIVLPIMIMQVVVTYLFFDIHWSRVSRSLSEFTASDISYITNQYIANPSTANFEHLKSDASKHFRLSVALRQGEKLPQSVRKAKIAAYDRTLNRALSQQLSYDYWFDTTRYPDYVDIRVQVPEGVLRYLAYRDRVFASSGGLFITWLLGATLILATISVLFIRNQIKPMERLAEAAEEFGKGKSVNLRPHGSREVRNATRAFLEMRNRIQRHIEQRTHILAGVSHDLRTPITRLKLELAMMPQDENIKAAQSDLKQMEEMLEEYLDFAKGEWANTNEYIDIYKLAAAAYHDARRINENITIETDENEAIVTGKATSIKRCFDNLISNALQYGNNVKVGIRCEGNFVFFTVEDDGPGLKPEEYDKALNPFSRLDEARNQNKKGVGLGLAIVRDVARSHGGELQLAPSDMGGLKAVIRLPKS